MQLPAAGRLPKLLRAAAVALLTLQAQAAASASGSGASELPAALELLRSAAPQEGIRGALRAERNRTLAAASSAAELRRGLQLGLLQLPVPLEVQQAAAAAASSVSVTEEDVDQSTTVLNKMLQDAQWQLDRALYECHVEPERYRASAQAATADVQSLSSELSFEHSAVIEATSLIPQESEWFQSLKSRGRYGRYQCLLEQQAHKSQELALKKDAWTISQLRKKIGEQCGGGNFLQLAAGKPCRRRSARKRTRPRLPRLRPRLARRLQPWLLQLRAVALQRWPAQCRMEKQACEKTFDVVDEIAGELADGKAQLLNVAAASRKACEEDRAFEESEMRQAAHMQQDLSEQLAEATSRTNALSQQEEQRDTERDALERRFQRLTASCARKVSAILHRQVCGLQRMRDQLWLLAGRTTLPEDCEVTDWQDGACSVTCGKGTQLATREVISPAGEGGVQCPPLEMKRSCSEDACPTDCEVSMWSGWSRCSAQCDSGLQQRTRATLVQARNGGDGCPNLVDERVCSGPPCTVDCVLRGWSGWSFCSRACDGGTQSRHREVKERSVGNGQCPAKDAEERLQQRPCNVKACTEAESITCSGTPLDVVLLVDSSGSISEDGFEGLKQLAMELVSAYAPRADGPRVAMAAFAKDAKAVSLTEDGSQLKEYMFSFLLWQKGPSMLGAGLLSAGRTLLTSGRPEAVSTVIVLTDGRISDPFLSRHAAARLRSQNARLVFAVAGLGYKNRELLEQLATAPAKENVLALPPATELVAVDKAKAEARKIILGTCEEVSEG